MSQKRVTIIRANILENDKIKTKKTIHLIVFFQKKQPFQR